MNKKDQQQIDTSKKNRQIIKDKRFTILYIIVAILLIVGATYAITNSPFSFSLITDKIAVDFDAYGNTEFDSSKLDFSPVLDNDVEKKENHVIKIEFKVGGAATNNTKDVIYDIALNDLKVDCSLLSPYIKWKLLKNEEEISSGSFDYKFDTIKDGRLVLTNIQQDLPVFSETQAGYDSYIFYLWFSDSCQSEDLDICKEDTKAIDQSEMLNKVLQGKIEVELYTASKKALVRSPSDSLDRATCDSVPLSSYIKTLYHDENDLKSIYIEEDKTKPIVTLNEKEQIMLDDHGEYRFYGSNPNNYVVFNDELWRIISVSNVKKSINDKKGETRIKIIRNDSLGNYSYDSSNLEVNSGFGVNDWGKADLMLELNTLYYSQEIGTCYTGANNLSNICDFSTVGLSENARKLIDDALWTIGGNAEISELSGNDYYNFERSKIAFDCKEAGDACLSTTSWIGKIGLMYPSDYSYATDLSKCLKKPSQYHNDTNCLKNNWLFNASNQWTLSPYSNNAFHVFGIHTDGYVTNYETYNAWSVRPVVFLKESSSVLSGDGTITNPYQLG